MRAIRAERLIYSRVEAAYSPRRSSGFQTVWKSESITAAETAVVEKVVQCFRPSPGVRRLQFFQIPGDKFALTHTARIDAHPEIVDRNSREGAFLVHCFLLAREDMAYLENDPFRFFDACPPLDGIEQLVKTFGSRTGNISPIELIAVERRVEDSNWATAEVARLLSVTLRAGDLRRQGRTVPVIGDCNQIEQTLRLAIRLTRVPKRTVCTFTTWAEGCPLERGLFWASGLPRRASADSLEIDARGKRITLPSSQQGMGDLYCSWIEWACIQNPLEKIIPQAESVDLFLQAVEGSRLEGEVPLRADALTNFLHLHRHVVADRIHHIFERHVRRPLAKELAYHILTEVGRPEFPVLLESTVSSPSQTAAIARLATDWLERNMSLDENFRQELQDLARKSSNSVLLFWTSTLGRKVDAKARDEAMGMMSNQEFKRAMKKILHPTEPVHFVSLRHLSALLENDRLGSASEDHLVEMIERVVDVGGGSHLDSLIPFVYRIGEAGLHRIARKIRKQEVAPRFRREIENASPRQGLLKRIFS